MTNNTKDYCIPRPAPKYSPRFDKEEIIEMVSGGLCYAEIARAIGCSRAYVQKVARAAGHPPRSRGLKRLALLAQGFIPRDPRSQDTASRAATLNTLIRGGAIRSVACKKAGVASSTFAAWAKAGLIDTAPLKRNREMHFGRRA